MKRRVPGNMTECFNLIETGSMFKGPWVMGDTYTIADPYLYTLHWLAGDGVDIVNFPPACMITSSG